jgi:hypothetical protein
MNRAIFPIVAALIALTFGAAPAAADPVADFYKGKRITLVVSYGTGGGYDVYGRMLARYMSKYIPGNPSIIVQNMPGAGSLRGANFLYNVAPKDGTTFGIFARNMPLLGLIKTVQNVQFDPTKFTWLGSSSSYAHDAYLLIVRRDSHVQSVEEARRQDKPPLVLGSTAEGTSSDAMAILLRDMLGLNIRVVTGYTDVPIARELARNDQDRKLIEIVEVPYQLSRPFAAPPGVPPDRAKALQDAFLATHKDPEYLADAERMRIDVSPIGGPEVLKLINDIGRTPPDELKKVERLIESGG